MAISAESKLHIPDITRYVQRVLSIAGDVGKGKTFSYFRVKKRRYFVSYPSLEKRHSHLPIYAHQRAAKFDTPVPHNTSNVFEVTTFNETVEMARVTVSRDLVYIRETDYPGEYATARDFEVPAAQIYFQMGFVSNRCQVPNTCSSQWQQQRLQSNAASNRTIEMASTGQFVMIYDPKLKSPLKRDHHCTAHPTLILCFSNVGRLILKRNMNIAL